MKKIQVHIIRNLIAGAVALLPVGGLILTIGYLESTISGSGLSDMPFYFPGLGLLAAVAFIYGTGLVMTTLVGRWIWTRADRMLDSLPMLGRAYQTLKQILGYGEGKEAIFYEAVLIPADDSRSEEFGLVTNTLRDEEGNAKLVVFVPGSPNPTSGRLIIIDRRSVRPLAMPVSEAMKALVSVGKTEIDLKGRQAADR